MALAHACDPRSPPLRIRPPDLCDELVARCGGEHAENWYEWCASECVPDHARTVPCALNEECILCDAPRDDGNTTLFALPVDDLEYLWTLTDGPTEPNHPATERAPTGTPFDDGPGEWRGDRNAGAWRAYEPFPLLSPLTPNGFCEPGPNRYLASLVSGNDRTMQLRAGRMVDTPGAPFCDIGRDYGRCEFGPYVSCEHAPTGCQYRETPDRQGLGTSSQVDRYEGGQLATYQYGTYRSIFRAAGGPNDAPRPGFVYAFFTQSNEPCVDGVPNIETNTSEIDVEISGGFGDSLGGGWCRGEEMCIQISTWVSSDQGIENHGGILRHQVSAFRFRDRGLAGEYHTYGFDWQPTDVRFTYDRDPHDCDEAAGACVAERGSLALCRNTRFVPRRPAPLHFQLWNAWWAGEAARGTTAEMTIERVWHVPADGR